MTKKVLSALGIKEDNYLDYVTAQILDDNNFLSPNDLMVIAKKKIFQIKHLIDVQTNTNGTFHCVLMDENGEVEVNSMSGFENEHEVVFEMYDWLLNQQ